MKRPKPTRADARHEAAHAVVGVRLSLPLASTEIGYVKHEGRGGTGLTALVEGSTDGWNREPDGRAKFERYTVQIAAGICAEVERGAGIDAPENARDLHEILQVADGFGVGGSFDDLAVRAWLVGQVEAARKILYRDDGRAWERVTVNLLRKRKLSAAEVRALVVESDGVT